jgi:hypothetical protein
MNSRGFIHLAKCLHPTTVGFSRVSDPASGRFAAATPRAKARRWEGTLGQTRLGPIAEALQQDTAV